MKTFYREAKDLGNGLKRITYYSPGDLLILNLMKLPFIFIWWVIKFYYLIIKWFFVIYPFRILRFIFRGIGKLFKMIFHKR